MIVKLKYFKLFYFIAILALLLNWTNLHGLTQISQDAIPPEITISNSANPSNASNSSAYKQAVPNSNQASPNASDPVAIIVTNKGSITIRLFANFRLCFTSNWYISLGELPVGKAKFNLKPD